MTLHHVWFLRYGQQQTEFFVILDHFCHFNPLTFQKIKTLKKMKKIPGDIIVLHKCTKTYDHMLYCSWDMAHVVYDLFWDIFRPFIPLAPPPLTARKNENLLIFIKQALFLIKELKINQHFFVLWHVFAWIIRCYAIFCN